MVVMQFASDLPLPDPRTGRLALAKKLEVRSIAFGFPAKPLPTVEESRTLPA